MSQKRDRKIRGCARYWYERELYGWRLGRPAKWRVFKYLKWKKQKPVYEYTEKRIKKIAKGR